MKKTVLLLSLLFGLFFFSACSSDDDGQPFETYDSVDFTNFIKSQYSNQSILVLELSDGDFYNTNDGYSGKIAIGALVFVKDANGNYSVDGYSYEGRIENNNRNKIYDASQRKAFSIPIDKSDDRSFILDGLIVVNELGSIGHNNYRIKASTTYTNSFEVSVSGGTPVVVLTGILETFVEQCQDIMLEDYSIYGKWVNEEQTKAYIFDADKVTKETYSYSNGTRYTLSGSYHYFINIAHLSITNRMGGLIENIEDKYITYLSDTQLQMMDKYSLNAWNDREIYYKVNE